MKAKLFYNTIKPELNIALNIIMGAKEFEEFRLVGGTSLSLQLGHRISVDIDLFTDAEYRSVNFDAIDDFLRSKFPIVEPYSFTEFALGRSYYLGNEKKEMVKLDLYYTDPFIRPIQKKEKFRLAHIEDIIAMKLEVIGNGGRKKDFWDIDELLGIYTISQMLDLYAERYPYSRERNEMVKALTDFSKADEEPDPISLKDKPWQLIKFDIEIAVNSYFSSIR